MKTNRCGLVAAVLMMVALIFQACSADECLPACAGKSCGDDGCGGSCGECNNPPPGVCYTGAGECVAGGCQYATVPDGSACDDGLYCNGNETCQSGVCRDGSPVDCSPPTGACLVSQCDETSQSCLDQQVPDGSACDDGDACTSGDTCQSGVCVPGQDVCQHDVAILMYLAGDNDLDESNLACWQEMETARVDDSSWLRVFLLVDRAASAEWSDTRFYELHNNGSEELEAPNLGLTVAGTEELNLSDGATVTAFVQDVRALVGGETSLYLLLLDHGDGWWKRGGTAPSYRGCCYDESSGDDYLAQAELSLAIRNQEITLIGFDACLMGMAEVAYEHRQDAQVLIASQEMEGVWGWDYATLLSDFGESTDPSPELFAEIAVDTYIELSLFNKDQTATMAAYHLDQIDPLAEAATDMAAALAALSTEQFNDLCAGLTWYGCYGSDCEEYADLVQLAELAKQLDPGNGTVYDAVVQAVSNAVFVERHGNEHPEARGLNVAYACYYYPYDEYADNTWAIDTGWWDMVCAH